MMGSTIFAALCAMEKRPMNPNEPAVTECPCEACVHNRSVMKMNLKTHQPLRNCKTKIPARQVLRRERGLMVDIIIPDWAKKPEPPKKPSIHEVRESNEYKERFALALLRILFSKSEYALTTMSHDCAFGNSVSGKWTTHDLHAIATADHPTKELAESCVLEEMGYWK